MPHNALEEVLRFITCLGPGDSDRTDRELMEQFISHHEESAFAFLVRRHGPMVLNVCRRILGSGHDTEDAFQATFLVLVRRLMSIRQKESIGGWLHCVARRVALRARAQAAARRNREQKAGAAMRPVDDLTSQEVRAVLDEEIALLPEKYSTPIVLCYLEGKSYEQAARQIGCPKPSLASRLARARELLRRRLERRGITVAVAALTTALTEMGSAAPLPAMLTIKAIKAAVLVAAGKSVVGCMSAGAGALAEEAVVGMVGMKGKLALMVLMLGLAVGGVGWAGSGLGKKAESVVQTPVAKDVAGGSANKEGAGRPTKKEQAVDQYGDPLPEGALARLGTVRFRHDGNAWKLAFSQDGQTLVGGTVNGVFIWDAANGKVQHRLSARAARPSTRESLDISPDSKTLVLLGEHPDGATKFELWELKSGKRLRSFALPVAQKSSATAHFSPDGKSLVIAVDQRIHVFDVASAELRKAWDVRAEARSLSLSTDGKTLAVAMHHPGVQLWNVSSGQVTITLDDPKKIGSGAVAFSRDGKAIAWGTFDCITLSDPITGKELQQLHANMGSVSGLGFTPDGETLVSGSQDGKVRVWDLSRGEPRHTLASHDQPAEWVGGLNGLSMALSSDGKTVALGTVGSVVRLWDVGTGKVLFPDFQGHDGKVNCLKFSPDGKSLFSGEFFFQIRVWNTDTWKPSGVVAERGWTLSFTPDGARLASVPVFRKIVDFWDAKTLFKAGELTVPDTDDVRWAAYASDGNKLLTVDTKFPAKRTQLHSLRLWDVVTGKLERTKQIGWSAVDRGIPSNGMSVAIVSKDGIHLHNLQTDRERLLHGSNKYRVTPLDMSADGRFLLSGDSEEPNALRLWELATGKELSAMKGHDHPIMAAAWSPDARIVASGDGYPYGVRADNATVRLWDIATGKEVARFGGIKKTVRCLTFSPDGHYVVAGLEDGTILVWDVQPFYPQPAASRLTSSLLEDNWKNLAGDDGETAHQSSWTLIGGRQQAIEYIRNRLSAVKAMDDGKIKQLIAGLESASFSTRQAAQKELVQIGDSVKVAIQKTLKGNVSLETRRRLEVILNAISDVPAPDTLRTIRAIMVLERIGSPEAQAVLATLAGGAPGARETEEAKASLERLKLRTHGGR